jgi:hypothetical protein
VTREELAEWIAHPVYSPRVKRYGTSMEDALRLVDEYAHELAEKQRAALPDVMERWAHCLHQDTISEVIDLTDPEVSNGDQH